MRKYTKTRDSLLAHLPNLKRVVVFCQSFTRNLQVIMEGLTGVFHYEYPTAISVLMSDNITYDNSGQYSSKIPLILSPLLAECRHHSATGFITVCKTALRFEYPDQWYQFDHASKEPFFDSDFKKTVGGVCPEILEAGPTTAILDVRELDFLTNEEKRRLTRVNVALVNSAKISYEKFTVPF